MRPKAPENSLSQYELFKTKLSTFLNSRHPLIMMSDQMDWNFFDSKFGLVFSDQGRPALSTRLMVALFYLKQSYSLSDEALIAGFLENPYWQYFCGFEYFQHQFPCDPSSMTRWRNRLGESGCEHLLKETIRLARENNILKESELKEVIVDTTVQEKAITFPTDAKLLNRAREKLVMAAKFRRIDLRQSYSRVGKYLFLKQSGYAHAKQFKRSDRVVSKLRTFLGRVLRDVQRKCPEPDKELQTLMDLSWRVYRQKKQDSQKLYSLHEPFVDCLAKGKAGKPYEFGCKTSVVLTAKSNWVIGVKSFHQNPYDGKTLKPAILAAEQITEVAIQNIFVDRGYRGSQHWPEGKQVFLSGRRKLQKRLKKLLKRRSAIEPVIGHLKSDHRLKRNLLKGILGDHVNGILAGSAFNFKKILNHFRILCLHFFQLFKLQNLYLRFTLTLKV